MLHRWSQRLPRNHHFHNLPIGKEMSETWNELDLNNLNEVVGAHNYFQLNHDHWITNFNHAPRKYEQKYGLKKSSEVINQSNEMNSQKK